MSDFDTNHVKNVKTIDFLSRFWISGADLALAAAAVRERGGADVGAGNARLRPANPTPARRVL
jgi:hypothetical protein